MTSNLDCKLSQELKSPMSSKAFAPKRKKKDSGLAGQAEQIKVLWAELARPKNHPPLKASEIPQDQDFKRIQQWLCDEGICNDFECALKVIDRYVGKHTMTPQKLTLNEFQKLFQKGMFKNALLKLAQRFDNQQEAQVDPEGEELSLFRKLEQYQRKSMIKGLDRNAETHQDIKKMLNSLRDIV